MDVTQLAVAERCLQGAETGSMDFPAIVGALMTAGFDGYLVDYRCATVSYYLPDGEGATLDAARHAGTVPSIFDAGAVAAAVREAQTKAPGYSYAGFSAKVTAAGCAGYLATFSGRRVLYFGRNGETHVEHFPD